MTGLPYWIGLTIFTVLVIIAAVSGGVKGVATAIVIQGVIMTLSVIVLFIMGSGAAGPYTEVVYNLTQTIPEWFVPRLPARMAFSIAILWSFTTFTLPHVTMSALTYKNTKVLHNAIKVGTIVVAVWLFCLNFLAFPIKALFPTLKVPDMAVPLLTVTVLPSWVAGLVLAGVCGAVQSSIGGMIVALSSCFVKDFYQTLFKPKAKPQTLKILTICSTLVISVIIFLFALDPPSLLASLITYSTGGLTVAFTHTLLLGYYWKGANEYGAIAGIGTGIVLYLVIDRGILPISLGMNPVIISLALSTVIMLVVCKVTPKSPYGIIATWFGKDYPQTARVEEGAV
jgi:sodium/pantothenate symporter